MTRELFGVGCNVVIYNRNKKLLLLKRSSHLTYRPLGWDLPGGKMRKGETPYEAIIREAHEETRLQVKNIFPFDVRMLQKADCEKDIVSIKFVALADTSEVVLSGEHTEYRWSEFADLPLDPGCEIRDIIYQTRDLFELIMR